MGELKYFEKIEVGKGPGTANVEGCMSRVDAETTLATSVRERSHTRRISARCLRILHSTSPFIFEFNNERVPPPADIRRILKESYMFHEVHVYCQAIGLILR